MSTEILEAPKTEVQPPAPTPDTKGILAGVIKKAEEDRLKSAPGSQSTAARKAAEKEQTKPAPTEQKKPDATVTPEPPKDDKEKNFAELRRLREVAEKERDEYRTRLEALTTEHETYKSRPDPAEVQKHREELERQLNETRTELKAAAITRDPEFQAKYDQGIQRKQQLMISILKASGIDGNEATSAVAQWNKGKFGEYVEGLPALQQVEFVALIRGAEDLAAERTGAIENAEKTYQERETARRTQSEQSQAQFRNKMKGDAEAVVREMSEIEGIKGNEGLIGILRSSVLRAAPLEQDHMSSREVFQHVAKAVLFEDVATRQQANIEELKTKQAELQKKLDEQEAFIADRNGSIARPGNGGTIAKPKEGGDSFLLQAVKKFNGTK